MGDVLGLQSMFQQAGQGFGSGVQSLADALTQRKKQQQAQQQIGIEQQRADSEKAFQQGQLENEDTKQNFEARKYRDAAPARALEVEGKKTDVENAKAEEARKAKQFEEVQKDKDVAEHVGGMITQDEANPENDRDIMIAALKKDPEADIQKVRGEIKKQRQQIKEQGISDAQKKAQTYETNARGNLANAQAGAAGGAKSEKEAVREAGAKSTDELLQDALDLANSGKVNFGLPGKVAENGPDMAKSPERMKLDSTLAELTSALNTTINNTTRAPAKQELELLKSSVLPSLNSTMDQKQFTTKLSDVQRRIKRLADEEKAAVGSRKSLATTMAGPAPAAPSITPPPNAVLAPDQPSSSMFKKRLDRRGK